MASLKSRLSFARTPETIIGEIHVEMDSVLSRFATFAHQWANVSRWEMRPRILLRTADLWQEGHTAQIKTFDEAMHETKQMLDVYARLL